MRKLLQKITANVLGIKKSNSASSLTVGCKVILSEIWGKWNFKIKNVTKFQSNCTPAMVHILVRQLPVALFTQLLCSGPDPGTWIHSWSSKPSHGRNSVSVWPAAWRCGSWKV